MLAVAIRVDGSVEEIDASYESMREAIGGWLEIAPHDGPFTVYCDEEGKIYGKPVNRRANDLVNRYRSWDDPLAGDVVVCGPVDSDGENTEFTLADLAAVEGVTV